MGSGTVEGGRAAIEWGQAITIYRTAGKDWDVWRRRQEKSRIELAESDEKDTASGRECFGVHVFLRGGYGGGEGIHKKVEVVRFGTHNIQIIRHGCIELALRGIDQANVDLGLLQGAKINVVVYVRDSADFCIIVSDGRSRHRGGMALFYK